MSQVEIVTVRSRGQMDEFLDLPRRIYRGDSRWAPPLKADVRRLLDPTLHPFWQFSERELFLAVRGGQAIGRIAAIVDRNHIDRHQEQAGAWGFFECIDDESVSAALFAAAEAWLAGRDMVRMRGPYNPSLNYEVGLLVEGHQHPPALMIPYQPSYYLPLVEQAGHQKEKDLYAFFLTKKDPPSARFQKMARRVRERNHFHVRSAELAKADEELALMRRMYNECWADEWHFVPMTEEEVQEMGAQLRRFIDPDLLLFFYDGETPVGMCLIVPDLTPLLRALGGKLGILAPIKYLLHRRKVRGLRGLVIGFKPEYQRRGLPLVAFEHVNNILRTSSKYDYIELGWNLEDNADINRFDAEMGASRHKRIRLFCKEIASP